MVLKKQSAFQVIDITAGAELLCKREGRGLKKTLLANTKH